jgi:IS30 family transposase
MSTYRRISYADRVTIENYLELGYSITKIADKLGFHKSSISKELKRHKNCKDTYHSDYAQEKTKKKSSQRRKNKHKLTINPKLRDVIIHLLLSKKWSPDQVSQYLKKQYPNDSSMQISHETIYQYIYVLPKGELKKELQKSLRQERKYRRKQKSSSHKETRGKITGMFSIHERPAEVADRTVPGHWESDLIIGKGKKSAIATLVERTTRYTILVPLPNGRDAFEVRKALTKVVSNIPYYLCKTITHDQGKEMSQHKQFAEETGITVYFADPSSPWQRGTNENTNGLIRQFFPKGTDFNQVATQELKEVQDLLNERPRRAIDYMSPDELYSSYVAIKH